MASKKHTTDQPRFRVESIGSKFALVDWGTGDIEYCPAGTTRTQADRQCDALNGNGEKTPRDPPSHERRFQKRGELVTFEEIENIERRSMTVRHPIAGPLDPDIYGRLRTNRLLMEKQKERELIAGIERQLPAALTDWGAKVAAKYGYAGQGRKDWPVDLILAMIDTGAIDDVLVAHFVSAEPSHIKARYFGIEKRAYLNRVKAAIQRLARWHASRLIEEAVERIDGARPLATNCHPRSWHERLSFEEDWESNDEDKRRGGRRYPRISPATPCRPAIKRPHTEAEASIRARMDQLNAVFGRQSQRETLPVGVENARSLAESGINPSDEI
jgi:hypothetical protein